MEQVIVDQSKIFSMNPLEIKVKDELPRIRKEIGQIEELANSLKKFGQLQPIVINKNNELVAGGRRLAACLLAEIDAKVCYFDAVDPDTMRELEIEENIQRKAFTAAEECLALEEIHRIKQSKYGDTGPGAPKDGKKVGWSLEDTAKLVGRTKSSVAADILLAQAIKNFPELKKLDTKSEIRSVVKSMDRVAQQMEGLAKYEETVKQATEFVLVNRAMEKHIIGIPDASIDLVLTDPAYGIDIFDMAIGVGGKTGGENSTGVEYEDSEEYAKNLLSILATESFRITKDSGHAYIFCAPSNFWWLVEEMKSAGWTVRERPIIWIKRESGQNNQPSMWPSSAYEFILFARKQNAKLVQEGRVDWIQVDPVAISAKLHQAEKPIPLLKELIARTTLPGQYIYDPFAGSGSTIEAAAEMKVFSIGCEIDVKSYAAMITRMQVWKEKVSK